MAAEPVRSRTQGGFALIEVLMAMLLFSVGILGMVALQARAAQFSTQSEDRSRAALLANEIVAQMWMAGTTSLDAATVKAWNDRVADTTVAGLPDGAGVVSAADANGVVTVTLTWKSPGRYNADASNSYVTKVAKP